jgi:hypothetical protein
MICKIKLNLLIFNIKKMIDIKTEKLWLIEHVLKMQDEVLLHRLKTLIENLIIKGEEYNLEPMSLETFYARIEESEKAMNRGEIITQDELKEEVKTWKKR